MKRATFCLALALAFPLAAQDALRRNAEIVAAAALTSGTTFETAAYLTDEIGPRLSGSRNADLAVKWTTERLRSWGLDVYQQTVKVPHWVRGEERATLVSHNDQKIVLTALGGSVATPRNGLTADVVEVRSFEELEKLGRKGVEGKIVFFHAAMDRKVIAEGRAFDAYSAAVRFRGTGASRAAEYGAVAAVIRSVASESLRTPHTGSLRYAPDKPKIPAAALTEEDAMLIERLLKKGQRVRMRMLLTPRTLPDAMSANVIAEIRGSEKPNEIVVIGGHLDSWDLGTGAIDNASGVAMVMETMRILKQSGIKPRRTIRCVLFMNEENGLNGGRTYFETNKDKVNEHVAAIEVDAGVGALDRIMTTLSGAPLQRIEGLFLPLFERVGKIRFETSTGGTGADTSFLTKAFVPGFGMIPDARKYFHYHHSPADTLDKIDPKELADNTAAVAVLTYAIADSDITLR